MERLKAEEARLREQQQYGDWQKKEEHFHLKQANERSKVTQSAQDSRLARCYRLHITCGASLCIVYPVMCDVDNVSPGFTLLCTVLYSLCVPVFQCMPTKRIKMPQTITILWYV